MEEETEAQGTLEFETLPATLTPMMAQYLEIKRQYTDCLLFFRMGDFFELFFEDAVVASKILDIALTKRGKHMNEDVPMCGVPHHAVSYYISKLVKAGKRIAICDQMENPEEAKKRGYKAVVKREVVRVITAGTLIEDELIDGSRNNFLMSVVPNKKAHDIKEFGVSVIDISTGDFFSELVNAPDLEEALKKYSPSEIIAPVSAQNYVGESNLSEYNFSFLPDPRFNPDMEEKRIKEAFGISVIDGIADFSGPEKAAMGSLVAYIENTQKKDIKLNTPKRVDASEFMIMRSDTVNNLEIWKSSNGDAKCSLFNVMNQTKTPMGKRLLSYRFTFPLMNIEKIRSRLDSVGFFVLKLDLLSSVREILKPCGDIERALSRVKFMRASAKDLILIKEALKIYSEITGLLSKCTLPSEMSGYRLTLNFSNVVSEITDAIDEEKALTKSDGCIRSGFCKELDDLKQVRENSELLIKNLQAHYVTETGIQTLKIKRNNLIGWFVEIPLSQKPKVSDDFIWKQTISNSVRYTTLELDELQQTLMSADEKITVLEAELFKRLLEKISLISEHILLASKALAMIDVSSSLAEIAVQRNYCKPHILDDQSFDVKNARHPVVEFVQSRNLHANFTPNDCFLMQDAELSIITGPNMAGKSTYLRQNALIVLLAQIGSFVPADSARIGVVDKLFSRIGASDNLAYGRSTFMIEMVETAAILNQATNKSFVILDEVGRGTSTMDGLAIACGVVEHISEVNKCRTLFATHYHEIADLKKTMPNLKFQTLEVYESGSNVTFTHNVINGVADKSYGIHVARLAGIPEKVISIANRILSESQKTTPLNLVPEYDESLGPNVHDQKQESPVVQELKHIDVDSITPKEALAKLYYLKELAKE